MPTSKFAKIAAFIVTLSATLLSGAADATPIVYTSTGTIQSGYDTTGVFGSSGDLSGKAYSLSFTIDPTLYAYQYNSSNYTNDYGSSTGALTETVTVNGVTQTYVLDQKQYNYGQTYLSTSTWFSQVYQYQSGTTAAGMTVEAQSSIYNYFSTALATASLSSLSYQSVSSDYGYSYFNVSGGSNAYFSASTPATLSIKAAGDVPEPAPLALLGLGLVALGVSRRKTRT